MATLLSRPPPPADARLAYGTHPEHFVDVRAPRGAGPHPLALVVHGGFWRAENDLAHLGHACAALADAGVLTWNVEYRRVGHEGGAWPAPLDDVLAAAAYLASCDHRDIDRTRVVLVGFSAGAQIAACAAGAIARAPERFAGLGLRGAVLLGGLLDLRAASALRLGRGAVDALLGGGPGDVPARYDDASPIAQPHVGCPQLLVHGEADDVVPCAMSASYEAAARARGDDVRLRTVSGGHFDVIDPESAAWPTVLAAVRELLA